jgi:hypothetical protein
MQTTIKQLLTPLQLELLKIFVRDIDEKDILEISNSSFNILPIKPWI